MLTAPCSAARRDITVKIVVPTSGSLPWNPSGKLISLQQSRRAPPYAASSLDACLLLGAFRLAGELLLHSGRLIDVAETDAFHHRLVLDRTGGAAQFLGGKAGRELVLGKLPHLLQVCGRPGSIVFTG